MFVKVIYSFVCMVGPLYCNINRLFLYFKLASQVEIPFGNLRCVINCKSQMGILQKSRQMVFPLHLDLRATANQCTPYFIVVHIYDIVVKLTDYLIVLNNTIS